MTMPSAEIDIDAALARRLLRAQHPDLAALALRRVGEGWDNVIYRLGADLALRLPRHAHGARLIAHEQRWLPELAPRLPLPVPAPVRVGTAQEGFAWTWSVTPWIAGRTADRAPPNPDQAPRWAAFLKALHATPEPGRAPPNMHRGGALAARDALFRERLARLDLDAGPILRRWERACAAAPAAEAVWLHGDLHGRNVLTHGGAFACVLDWGDICAGDPACDLVSVWTLFADAAARDRVFADYGADADLAHRAEGWAWNYVPMLLESGDASHVRMGRTILRRLGV
jgi:aminoglycoside phosphotransferase (APT) family kinase protein